MPTQLTAQAVCCPTQKTK